VVAEEDVQGACLGILGPGALATMEDATWNEEVIPAMSSDHGVISNFIAAVTDATSNTVIITPWEDLLILARLFLLVDNLPSCLSGSKRLCRMPASTTCGHSFCCTNLVT